MKDYTKQYPLNTYKGEQLKELETLIKEVREEQKKELLEIMNDMNLTMKETSDKIFNYLNK